MNGFNWLTYYWFANRFDGFSTITDSAPFQYIIDKLEDWGDLNYSAQIKEFALSVSSLVGLLPTSFVYLFSIGLALTLVGIVIRIVLEVI